MITIKNCPAGFAGVLILPFLLSCSSLNLTNADRQIDESSTEIAVFPIEQTFPNPAPGTTEILEDMVVLEERTVPEPDTAMAQEIAALKALGSWEAGKVKEPPRENEITYDFPITINRQVEFYLDFFTKKQQKSFARWLARSGRYLPFIKEELQKAGLPQDLAYLPMIESGFSLTAYSRARAVGPWQFIRATGRRYGLIANKYVDERRDPEKATLAAIAYLKDLHDRFNSWPLAVAAYNAGEGKIQRAINKYKSNDFWKLAEKKYLKLETKRYVPKLIAAILIAKNPEKYGFTDIAYEAPLAYDTLTAPRWTSMRALAVASETSFEEIRNLNRQLRRAITPPDKPEYTVKVPVGKGKIALANLPRVKTTVVTDYRTHLVGKGDTLTGICRRYALNKTTLLKANNLRSTGLIPGKRLRIPYQTVVYTLVDREIGRAWAGPASPSMENLVLHKIKSGDTLSDIAKMYHIPMQLIAAWNGISNPARIRAGEQLALYLKDNFDQKAEDIAGAVAENKPTAMGKKRRPVGLPQKTLKTPKVKTTYYQVRGGDSLWKIAQKFRITPAEIRQWNKLESDLIHPGRRLLLKVSVDADV